MISLPASNRPDADARHRKGRFYRSWRGCVYRNAGARVTEAEIFAHRRSPCRRGAWRGPRRPCCGHAGADLRSAGAIRSPAGLPYRIAVAPAAVAGRAKGVQTAAAGRRDLYRPVEEGPAYIGQDTGNSVARMEPTGRANARPMMNSAQSGKCEQPTSAGPDCICGPGLRFAPSGLQ
jgi:hypothetical protein